MRTRCIFFAVLLLPLLSNAQSTFPRGAEAPKAKQYNAKQHPEHPKKDQYGTESSPFVVKITPSDNANPPVQTLPDQKHEQPSPDWWMVVPTWLLTFFTLGLFIYTARLWRATGQMVQESRNATQATQRAFVFIKNFEIHNHFAPTRLIILPQWENSGDTPTRNMLNHVNWICLNGDIPDDFEFPDFNGEVSTPTLIGPHAVKYASPLEIDSKCIDSTIAGTTRLFVWGWTEYNDVFPGTERHRTEFCEELLISRIAEKDVVIRFSLHRRHNGTDEECLKKPSSGKNPT